MNNLIAKLVLTAFFCTYAYGMVVDVKPLMEKYNSSVAGTTGNKESKGLEDGVKHDDGLEIKLVEMEGRLKTQISDLLNVLKDVSSKRDALPRGEHMMQRKKGRQDEATTAAAEGSDTPAAGGSETPAAGGSETPAAGGSDEPEPGSDATTDNDSDQSGTTEGSKTTGGSSSISATVSLLILCTMILLSSKFIDLE